MSNKPYISLRGRVDQRKSEKAKQKKLQFSDFLVDVKRNPMILIGLGGSGILTLLAGLFIGLAPRLDNNGVITFFGGVEGLGAAVMGILFGVLYAVTFPVIGEYGVYYWHKKASLRDEDNKTQAGISYTMLTITIAFTTTTAIAATYILLSLLHTFTAFQAIPEWAQKWTGLIIPVALILHAVMNIWYDHVSKFAEERREMERTLQMVENEAENRIRQARVDARERAAIAAADQYERLAKDEAITTGKEMGRRAWKQDKVTLGGEDDMDSTPSASNDDYFSAGPNGRDKETVNPHPRQS